MRHLPILLCMNSTTQTLPLAGSARWPIWAALATVYIVWGSTYLAIRFALVSFPPFLQMGTRFLVAGLILFAFLRWRGTPLPNKLQWRNATIVGALMLGCGMGLTAYAEQTVSSSLTAILVGTIPLMTAVWSAAIGERPGRLEWTGILIGFGGVLLLAGGAGFAQSPGGMLAMVLACTAWTIGSMLSQRGFQLAPGAMGFASEMLAGGALLLAVGWATGERIDWPPQPLALAAWVYLVVAGSLGAFSAYMYLLSKVSPGLATSYAYVNPVIAVLLGVAVGGEHLTPRELAATGIILASVVLITARTGRKKSGA
jgi:drug/metabolite transporter (DMT)-like permease